MLISDLASELSDQMTKLIYVEYNNVNGQYYVHTPFVFADGDKPVITLAQNDESYILSDLGNTLFRLLYPINQLRLDSALSMSGITNNNSVLTKPIQPDNFALGLFDFIHALLKIDELGDYSHN